LDGIIKQTLKNIPNSQKCDKILNYDVIKGAGKMLSMDENSLLDILKLRVNSSIIHIDDFSLQSGSVCLSGSAKYIEDKKIISIGRKKIIKNVLLCTMVKADNNTEIIDLWKTNILKKSSENPKLELENNNKRIENINVFDKLYTQGGVWLPDQKYVAKGFIVKSTFECDWTIIKSNVSCTHPLLVDSVPTVIGIPEEEMSMHSMGSISTFNTYRTRVTNDHSAQSKKAGTQKGHLLLGGISCVVHTDKQGVRTIGTGDLGTDLLASVCMGVSFHAHIVEYHTKNFKKNENENILKNQKDNIHRSIQYYARIFVIVKGDQKSRFSRTFGSSESVSSTIGGEKTFFENKQEGGNILLGESFIDIDRHDFENMSDIDGIELSESRCLLGAEGVRRCIRSSGSMALEVEYSRDLISKVKPPDVSSSVANMTLGTMIPGGVNKSGINTTVGAGLVVYKLKGRLINTALGTGTGTGAGGDRKWDIETSVDLTHYVKLQGGQAFIGFVGSGLMFNTGVTDKTDHGLFSGLDTERTKGPEDTESDGEKNSYFKITLSSFDFSGKGALATYPVASIFTSARFPETFLRLEKEVSQFRAWMNLKLSYKFPAVFSIVFDSDAMSCYDRVFTSIMKIRLIAHALERLWHSLRKSRLAGDRAFCQVRQSMHFFITNLLYHLQVDVIDSEFSVLQEVVAEAADFQTLLRAHRNFLAVIMRLTFVDNLTVQEGIERVLQVYIFIYRYKHTSICIFVYKYYENV
jgi:hypothetical protein